MMNIINSDNSEGSTYLENVAKLHDAPHNVSITTQEYIGVYQRSPV